jgi:hypothetical protein
MTAKYLWSEVLDLDARGPDPRFRDSTVYTAGEHAVPPPSLIYAFVCDRTRQVRKDLNVQGYMMQDGPFSPVAVKVGGRAGVPLRRGGSTRTTDAPGRSLADVRTRRYARSACGSTSMRTTSCAAAGRRALCRS